MELRTPEIDRVLDALSPALAAELDRVKAEIRDMLEADFKKRLEHAVGQAELAGHQSAKADIEEIVAKAREEVRQQMTAELEARVRETEQSASEHKVRLDEAMKEELKKGASVWEAERNQLQDQIREWHSMADAQRQMSEVNSQAEILARMMKLSEPFAAALAIYLVKADGLALWKSRGEAAFPEIISQQTTDPESFFKIISVRGKTVAAICATPPYRADGLEFLAGMMERAIELFGLKLRGSGQAT
jgi:hypothetical protein